MRKNDNSFVLTDDEWSAIVPHLNRPSNETFYRTVIEKICSNYRRRKETVFPDVKSHRANNIAIAKAGMALRKHLRLDPLMPGLLQHLGSDFMEDLDWLVETFELIQIDESLFMASRAGTGGRMSVERQHLLQPLILVWQKRFGRVRYSATGPLMRFIAAIAGACEVPIPKALTVREVVKSLKKKNG